ncbi:DUF4058 family protein [Sphaerospermopsis torques-reginae]|uniref:DUF4058 family protein n=1 Tax=Sphaerospermopsis torques-reginae ITEP-024 TaxID=984208 RepID=A0ABX8WYT5_9CYAN|nr:DUF4058 family protein [Sphaerospermopsis torques-reginae]QYX31550.1 DUF4058 family protein [Sphaerospermopsis torques-reginae ITEP-024]
MTSIFPGMNPYLEHPDLFPGLHHLLISEIARFLSPQLRPKYRFAVEVRTYETIDDSSLLVGIPDVIVKSRQNVSETKNTKVAVAAPAPKSVTVTVPMPINIKEGYLEVKEVGTEKLITTIEILSPTNKRSGKGREGYQEKRQQVLGSRSNLVEIDLLRKGEPMPMFGDHIESDYRILVCRGNRRPQADLYAFNIQDIIPAFSLPLRADDSEPVIDLKALLNQVYEIYDYDLVIDYSQEPLPALAKADAAWADKLLRDQGLR